jgi:acetyltransferase
MGYPVVVKILSQDISHKSDVGGVRLNIGSARRVAADLPGHAGAGARTAPRRRQVQGFTVQPMVRKKHAHELIVGASVDPVFGPVILFGAGGTAVEVLADRALSCLR